MRRFHTHHDGIEVALTNFSLTFAKALLVFCVVLFLLINPKTGADGSKPKAEFLITVDWSSIGRYDVDTWMRLPDGTRTSYTNKESGVVFLERDDLGKDCNTTTNGGRPVNECEEITVIRGVVPGDYTVALHLYSGWESANPGPVPPVAVHVKVEKLNPTTEIAWQTTVSLDHVRQELGVVRFTVLRDSRITDFSTDAIAPMIYR